MRIPGLGEGEPSSRPGAVGSMARRHLLGAHEYWQKTRAKFRCLPVELEDTILIPDDLLWVVLDIPDAIVIPMSSPL